MNPQIEELISLYFSSDINVHELVSRTYLLGKDHGGKIWGQLSAEKEKELIEWKKVQDAKFASKQGKKQPYYGAIGGAYVYSYCNTSLGTAISVRNDATGEELNLTDYKDW